MHCKKYVSGCLPVLFVATTNTSPDKSYSDEQLSYDGEGHSQFYQSLLGDLTSRLTTRYLLQVTKLTLCPPVRPSLLPHATSVHHQMTSDGLYSFHAIAYCANYCLSRPTAGIIGGTATSPASDDGATLATHWRLHSATYNVLGLRQRRQLVPVYSCSHLFNHWYSQVCIPISCLWIAQLISVPYARILHR
ncbi:hypothetical protein NEOLEDRAFT_1136921, partial [Neolentinus lepideus HHB14362 ss-1]